MAAPPFLDAAALEWALPMEDAIDALAAAFARTPLPSAPPRSHAELDDGALLLMPASGPEGVGVKIVTVNVANRGRGLPLIQGVYALFHPTTFAPVALFDGAAITALRTAAVSGLATRYLARPGARRLVIFGAGVQAHSHLAAMAAVAPLEELRCVAPTASRLEDLRAAGRALGLAAEAAGPEAVAEADLVCTCTTSTEPVFDGDLLADGAHVNAVGAFRPDTRELDDATVRRARVVVESRAAALEEAGDLLIPLERGVIDRAHVRAELADVVRGVSVREDPDDVTLFKSVGIAFEDLVLAHAAFERAAA
jgi:ornithine cyclodeaminase/alanine dehydrogenase-like protein (mu-crystallin family)